MVLVYHLFGFFIPQITPTHGSFLTIHLIQFFLSSSSEPKILLNPESIVCTSLCFVKALSNVVFTLGWNEVIVGKFF